MDSIMDIRHFPGPIRKAEHVLPRSYGSLFVRGPMPPNDHTYLTVVGSRKHSDYGRSVCEDLVRSLAGLPVVIVSGLALGIDSIAHRVAIENGIATLAVPGSGLDPSVLYPPSHAGLASKIVDAGGCLVTPFPPRTAAAKWLFPLRNRLMAALSHAVLVIEAERKSGTLITARHAVEFNRDVLAAPGSIFSPQSEGSHELMRSGATPISCGAHLRDALNIAGTPAGTAPLEKEALSPDEREILAALSSGPLSLDELHDATGKDISSVSCAVSMLELRGAIQPFLGKLRLSLHVD